MSLFCENIEKVSLMIPGICQCFLMTWSIEEIMAFPKLLFHVPQQNSSNDTMTGSFQISNTVNPLLAPPSPGDYLFQTRLREVGAYLGGGGGGGLFNLSKMVVSGLHKN